VKRRGPANLGAKKITYTVVPAFKACSSPTGTHGSLLAGPSYQTTASSAESATLTTGAGASFKGVASLAIEVFCTDGATPPCSAAAGDQEDVKLTATSTDVRCKSSIGSNAALCPSANSAGGVVKEGKKAGVEIGQIIINDGGSDGLASTAPNTVFARQGIYIP
jgi:hypothetical protein